MLHVYLCEDSIEHRQYIEKSINDVIMIEELDMKIEISTDNPFEVIDKVMTADNCGLYILDIDFGKEINGLQLAEKIREYDPRGFIIFITSHTEMTYLTFLHRIEALDFIPKNNARILKTRLREALFEAIKRYSSPKNNQQKVFSISLGGRIMSFDFNDILYIETSLNSHKLILHTESQEIEFYGKLKDIELSLDDNFVRVHKSFLVNKNNIVQINKQDKLIKLKGGKECLASVRLIKNVL